MNPVALLVGAERMMHSQVSSAFPGQPHIPEDLQDLVIIGYIWGFLDATAQRINLDVEDPTFVEGVIYTFESLLGEKVGKTQFYACLSAQESLDSEFVEGMQLGGSEVVAWIQSGGQVEFVSDGVNQSAKEGRAVISGAAPTGLIDYFRRGQRDSGGNGNTELSEYWEHPEDKSLLECQLVLISVILAADNEISGAEVATTTFMLVSAFDLSEEEALIALKKSSDFLSTTSPGMRHATIIEAVNLIRSGMTIEQRGQLYNQLELIARADGLAQHGAELLTSLRSDWLLPDDAFEEFMRKAKPVAPKKLATGKSGCAVFLLAGVGLLFTSCAMAIS